MYPFSGQFWEDLAKRTSGPGSFRFIIQPLVAIALGIRDGLVEYHSGRPPYVIEVIYNRGDRRELLQSSIKCLLNPIIVAVVLDALFQYLILGTVYPVAAIIVGVLLMAIPYILARGITNRLALLWNRKHQPPDTHRETR